jgi:hypothetical protein
MKKLVFGSFSVLALSIVLFTSQTSCKKETVNSITKTDTVYKCTPTIQGLWTGATQNTSGAGQAWTWSIKADGTATYENTINGTLQFCVGTWTLTNGTWTCNTTCVYGVSTFVGATQTFTATYNATTGTFTNGTYATTSKSTDSGTFTLTEVN